MADVLIVEDDFSTRSNLIQLLEKSGHTILAAASGEEALDLLEKEMPDLIISDIMMPGIDGYELLRRVNGEESRDLIPFIFLTARTEISDYREGMLSGGDDFITKPFKAHDLLRSIETRLKKKEKSERKISQFKNNITRNVSHEFRTPLVPIIGYSQMIKENYWHLGPDEVLEMIGKINSSGSWMLKLIEKFLLLVELEGDTENHTATFCHTFEIIHQCAEQVAQANGRPDDLQVNLKSAAVSLKEQDLKRIAAELLENAFRFSGAGSPVVITSQSAEGFYFLTIKDSGQGISSEELKNISSFFQVSRQGVHQAGLGLGLAIVKKLAEKNKIEVSIESEPGRFTCVTLKLPLWIS
ncbi:MAG TPA: response regulator [Ignavibacteriales bacterium]|nr:response regulator [Ignavibacteriales bacterium]